MRQERLARERQAREPQITARAHGQETPGLARQLRGRLKFLTEHPLTAFVENNPDLREEHLELLAQAQEALRAIIALHDPQEAMSAALGQQASAPLS
jgi:hypothetical protein